MFIDTHIHLDIPKLKNQIKTVLNSANKVGVRKFIIPAINSNSLTPIVELSETYEEIFFSSGHHPNYLEPFNLDAIKLAALNENCVAIGECGLDWFRIQKGSDIKSVKSRQINIFEQQLKLAESINKPVILHSRNADQEMVDSLSKFNVRGVLHCYVGSDKLLELIDKDFYFGIGGVLTYKSSAVLKENVKKIPLNRLLLETDGPYLTPTPFRKLINESKYIPLIFNELAAILELDPAELEFIIEENTNRLFFS